MLFNRICGNQIRQIKRIKNNLINNNKLKFSFYFCSSNACLTKSYRTLVNPADPEIKFQNTFVQHFWVISIIYENSLFYNINNIANITNEEANYTRLSLNLPYPQSLTEKKTTRKTRRKGNFVTL